MSKHINSIMDIHEALVLAAAKLKVLAHELVDELADPNGPLGLYQSPGVPAGFETVLGYMNQYMPDELDLLEDPVTGTSQVGKELTRLSNYAGTRVIEVEAPEICKRAGINKVKAYKLSVLHRLFQASA